MPSIYANLVIVGLSGGVGCAARAVVRDLFVRREVEAWRVIVGINVLGSAAAGVLFGLPWNLGAVQVMALGGVLAGWTTYSAFSVDCVLLWQRGRSLQAFACWGATIVGAPIAALGSFAATTLVLGGGQ